MGTIRRGPLRAAWLPGRPRVGLPWRGATLLGAAVLVVAALPTSIAPGAAASAGGPVPVLDSGEAIGGPALATAGLAFTPRDPGTPSPTVPAKTWLIADLDTGAVLAANGAHVRRPPASTLKTLTAVTLMPRLPLDVVRVATDSDVRVDGGTTGMVAGGTYSTRDLWHGLLLDSGNDTALALAHLYAEDTATTVDLMATEAQRLRALDTEVRNPHGMDAPGQVSSAYDMALFARAALAIPYFREVSTTRAYEFPMPGGSFQIQNENRLLTRYEGVIGGKTGFTSKAGSTFWGAAQRGDRSLLVVMFGVSGRLDRAAAALLDWGFAHADDLDPVGVLVEPSAPNRTQLAPQFGDDDATRLRAASPAQPGEAPVRWPFLAVAAGAVALGLLVSRGERRGRDATSLRGRARRH